MTTLSALQRFGFRWVPAKKTTSLQELAGRYGTRLLPGAQIRLSVKNGNYIQILYTALTMNNFFEHSLMVPSQTDNTQVLDFIKWKKSLLIFL